MRFISCVFESPDDFLESFSQAVPDGALLCSVGRSLDLGEELLVEIWFPGLATRMILRGVVAHIESDGRALIGLHRDETHTRDYLLAMAKGTDPYHHPVTRNHRRLPAAVPVSCRIEEIDEPEAEAVIGHTGDLGPGGAFVHSSRSPAVGTRLSVVLGPTDGSGETYSLDGRVAWIRRSKSSQGFGVKFEQRSESDAKRLRTTLRRAWESGRLDLSHSARD